MSAPARQAARHFLLALQFFTRVPITGRLAAWADYSPQALRQAAAWLPAVGWVVGAASAAAAALALWAWPPGLLSQLLAAALASAAGIALTGALHEDGLADTCDGLGGSASRERALAIMKDSRIGSYGALALALALLLKVLLLAQLAQRGVATLAWALIAAHVLSRLTPLLLMRALPYVSEASQAKSAPLAAAPTTAALSLAIALAAPAALGLGWALGLRSAACALLAWALAAWLMQRWLRRRLQGFTGDTLGAAQQAGELALYAALSLRWAAA